MNHDAIAIIRAEYDQAVAKAYDALGRYKFEMFGYWAAAAVRYGQLIEKMGGSKPANPFRPFVSNARRLSKWATDERFWTEPEAEAVSA